MESQFYIVDDDKSVRKILANIIEENSLGEVVGEACDGYTAEIEIQNIKPHIVLMDLLLPTQDGVETVKKLKSNNCKSSFIMISQVDAKDLIGKAYESGIEFFIQKPINLIEVLTVINKVKELIFLKNTFETIEKTLSYYSSKNKNDNIKIEDTKKKLKMIFSELGILGDTGCKDIINIITLLQNKKISYENLFDVNLCEIYKELSNHYKTSHQTMIDHKAIEMRIRRTIIKALSNIAMRTIEDYGNEYFIRYGNLLFDYKDLKAEMDYLRKKSPVRGKVNVKKFIEGLMLILEDE